MMTNETDVRPKDAPTASRPILPPILVADDDEDDLFFTARLLKKTGTAHPIVTFDDGTGVVDYLSRAWLAPATPLDQLPRLLFLDLKMAGLSGFGFLEWIRQHPQLAGLNVIVLSGSDEPQDVERAKSLGAKRYLAKHPSLKTFTTIVESVHRTGALRPGPAPEDFFAAGSSEWQEAASGGRRQRS